LLIYRIVHCLIYREAQQLFKTCFLAGFETEFILLTSQENVTSIGTENHWSCASPLYTGTVAATVMEEISEALELAGVDLDMYHAEGTPGQFEIVTSPLCLLEAADALTVTRETIYNVASKHGMRATLAPRPIPDTCKLYFIHLSISTYLDLQMEVLLMPTSQFTLHQGTENYRTVHQHLNRMKHLSCNQSSKTLPRYARSHFHYRPLMSAFRMT
jgi:hypothetical protein